MLSAAGRRRPADPQQECPPDVERATRKSEAEPTADATMAKAQHAKEWAALRQGASPPPRRPPAAAARRSRRGSRAAWAPPASTGNLRGPHGLRRPLRRPPATRRGRVSSNRAVRGTAIASGALKGCRDRAHHTLDPRSLRCGCRGPFAPTAGAQATCQTPAAPGAWSAGCGPHAQAAPYRARVTCAPPPKRGPRRPGEALGRARSNGLEDRRGGPEWPKGPKAPTWPGGDCSNGVAGPGVGPKTTPCRGPLYVGRPPAMARRHPLCRICEQCSCKCSRRSSKSAERLATTLSTSPEGCRFHPSPRDTVEPDTSKRDGASSIARGPRSVLRNWLRSVTRRALVWAPLHLAFRRAPPKCTAP